MLTPNRICSQCGTPLSSGETFCSNCGKSVEPVKIHSKQPLSPANFGSSNPSLPQMEPAQFPTSFAPSAPLGNPYGQESRDDAQPGEEYASSTSSGRSEPPEQPSPLLPPPDRLASPLQSKKAPKISIILGVILLLLILVGGGIFFLSRGRGASTNVTDNSTLTPKGPTQPALFSDSFADNSKGWPTGSGQGYNSVISNNEMSLTEANHKILNEPVPERNTAPLTFTDFSVSALFTILKGDPNDSAGLYLRGDNSLSQGYFVDIFGDNTYDLVKVFPDSSKDTFLISPTAFPAINPLGQQNKLTVIMKGSSIVLLINDKVVSSITDNTYTSGQIALFAENGRTSNGVNATFDSVAIYPAPAKLPS